MVSAEIIKEEEDKNTKKKPKEAENYSEKCNLQTKAS